MDWNSLKQKILPYMDKAKPYINTAKEYGQKAVVFAEDQLQTTPLFIKNQAEYDDLLIAKRTIILAYDEADVSAEQIRAYSPIWITRAFMDNATLRFISFSECHDLASSLGFTWPLDMRVRLDGTETLSLQTIGDIIAWWQSPIYKKSETTWSIPMDPLTDIK
jgi:hypothetical protein